MQMNTIQNAVLPKNEFDSGGFGKDGASPSKIIAHGQDVCLCAALYIGGGALRILWLATRHDTACR
jgi:hypothetical protein